MSLSNSTNKLLLYYYNHKSSNPIVFIIVKITSDLEEKMIEENYDLIFQVLIEQKFANDTNILVFHIVKEHKNKMINWVLGSNKSNKKILKNIEGNRDLINHIIYEIIKNNLCETCIILKKDEITIKECRFNLSFLTEIYF